MLAKTTKALVTVFLQTKSADVSCLKIAMPKTLAKCFCSKIVQSLGSNFTSCNYYGKVATNGHVALNSIFCIFSHNNAAKLCEKLQKKSYCLV